MPSFPDHLSLVTHAWGIFKSNQRKKRKSWRKRKRRRERERRRKRREGVVTQTNKSLRRRAIGKPLPKKQMCCLVHKAGTRRPLSRTRNEWLSNLYF